MVRSISLSYQNDPQNQTMIWARIKSCRRYINGHLRLQFVMLLVIIWLIRHLAVNDVLRLSRSTKSPRHVKTPIAKHNANAHQRIRKVTFDLATKEPPSQQTTRESVTDLPIGTTPTNATYEHVQKVDKHVDRNTRKNFPHRIGISNDKMASLLQYEAEPNTWSPPKLPRHLKNARQTDPELIEHIRNEWLIPPSVLPLDLSTKQTDYSQVLILTHLQYSSTLIIQ